MLKSIFGYEVKPGSKLDMFITNAAFTFLRFFIYGMIGVFAEVSQYTFVKVGRMIPLVKWAFQAEWKVDDKLGLNGIWDIPWYTFYGQCSLWMFPVYAFCSVLLLEQIYNFSKKHNVFWVVRGILYASAITIFEFISGFLLLWLTGYKIWYYSDAANILSMTSMFLFVVWFVTGMFVEFVYKELMESSLRKNAEDIADVIAMKKVLEKDNINVDLKELIDIKKSIVAKQKTNHLQMQELIKTELHNKGFIKNPQIHDLKDIERIKDIKQIKEVKEVIDNKDTKDTKDIKDIKEIKDIKNFENIKEIKDIKDIKDNKENK